jgi:hypothetical protein
VVTASPYQAMANFKVATKVAKSVRGHEGEGATW